MRGFTLIETVIYIALLGFIMSGTLLAVYTMMSNSSALSADTQVADEGHFVIAKLDWALGGIQSISSPSSGIGTFLSITRTDGTNVKVYLNGSVIEMSEDGGATYVPLTTSNVSVSMLQFERISGTPEGIEASTTINGETFTTRRYLPN